MKKIFFSLCVSSLAFAGSVNFDFRFESDSSSYNNAAKAAGAKPATQYKMPTGRVDFKGKLNEEVTFRLRTRLDKDDSTTVNKTDGFSSQVDYAYVQNTLMEGLSLTLGKFASEIGSVEGNMASPDIYMQSQAYRLFSKNGFLYVSGGKLTYTLAGHTGAVYIINQSDKTSDEQSKSTYGLTYHAELMEKKLKPIFGYLSDEKQSSTADTKLSTSVMSAGVMWDPKPYFVSFDYIIYAQKNVSAVNVNDTWTTMLIEAGYDFDGIIPKFKYESTDKKTGSVSDKYDGFTLGVEYKPYPQDMFRYHIMITQMTVKPEASDSQYEQHFLAGLRIYGDFLK